MRVLLCGEHGFIGRHLAAQLRAQGHEVRGLAGLDFCDALSPSHWQPLLQGVDAVVNAVGVLRDTRRRPMALVHTRAPIALFQACAEAGVRRVVHISALALADNPTLYAQSKLAAEQALLQLNERGVLDAVVLQPSIVWGRGGASTELFSQLARWPWLLLPAVAGRCRMQPVSVTDLAAVVPQLLLASAQGRGVLACTGPQVLTLVELLAQIRQRRGLRPALCWTLPERITQLSARLGDAVPVTPWGREALALMSQDNCAPCADFARWLGRAPCAVVPELPA
jgi:nucleoside-diphosphate-sugar epimerase